MNPPVLDVRVRTPLDRFDLDVEFRSECRTIGVFGPSGSGKTTLLESVAGLRDRAEGRVLFNGTPWLDSDAGLSVPAHRRGVGYVPQDRRLFPHLDVRANLEFGSRRPTTSSGRPPVAEFDEIVATLELSPLLDRDVTDLSGGEGQRVALGRALLSNPQLLILDEPLASLDHGLRHRILPFLGRVLGRFNIPAILVSHQPFELQALCDQVVALRAGRIVAQGSPTDVFTTHDVLVTSPEAGFENVLSGAAAAPSTANPYLVRLGGDGAPVLRCTPPTNPADPNAPVTVTVPARDVLVATQPVDGISARNVIPTTITEIRPTPAGHLVFTSPTGSPDTTLVAELTTDAVNELDLAPGQPVFAVIKSTAIRVYPAR